ncbi:MAG: COX15/CtaA family protein [Acidimicrobiales bacterium]
MADPAPPGGPGRASRLPTVSPAAFKRLCVVSLVVVTAIVVTGAAVRLTGSGLGCADWPTCSTGHLTPPLQFHALVEFGNRLVTVVVTVVVGVTFLAAWRRRPFRRDLTWLSAGLIGGVLAQAVLGGIVVYTKLNPYLVQVHFAASMLLVADAVVLVHRCRRQYGPGSGRLVVPQPIRRLTWGVVALLGVVVAAGTAVTGAGPHAGSAQGQLAAKRIPVPLRDMAELHSSLALLLIGLCLSLAVALHALDCPERVRRSARILVVVLVAQAAVGYTQYFTHLPPLLVEVHVLGATALVIGTVQFLLALTSHPVERPERGPGVAGAVPTEAAADERTPTEGAVIGG